MLEELGASLLVRELERLVSESTPCFFRGAPSHKSTQLFRALGVFGRGLPLLSLKVELPLLLFGRGSLAVPFHVELAQSLLDSVFRIESRLLGDELMLQRLYLQPLLSPKRLQFDFEPSPLRAATVVG